MRNALILLASLLTGTLQAQQPVSVDNPHVKHVVHVKCKLTNGNTSWGSGVWIDANHVLTALHVISEGEQVEVQWQGERIVADVITLEPLADWALLRTEPTEKTPPIEIRSEPVAVNEPLVGYGFGPSQNGRRTLVKILGKAGVNCILGNDKPRGGDSGGPVFDSRGRLVGIVNARIEGEPVWFGHGLGLDLKAFCEGRRGFRR